MRSLLGISGAVIIALLVITALGAALLAPEDPTAQDLARGLSGPGAANWLGCDKLGRDLLSRLIYGSRVSLVVGVVSVGFSAVVGSTLGMLAGYIGGRLEEAIMRVVDTLLAFPGILLAIALAAVLGPSLLNVIIALSALGWVGFTRLVRGEVLSLREREFVISAEALGVPARLILVRHILPNILGPVVIQATFGMAGAILAEASLSFLGLGTQGTPSWGAMITEGVEFLTVAPHLAVFPGVAIMLVVLGFNFLGDGLRDKLDPKQSA